MYQVLPKTATSQVGGVPAGCWSCSSGESCEKQSQCLLGLESCAEPCTPPLQCRSTCARSAKLGQTHLAMDSSRMQSRSMLPQFKAMAELSYLQQPGILSCMAIVTHPTKAPVASKQASEQASCCTKGTKLLYHMQASKQGRQLFCRRSASAGAKYRDTDALAADPHSHGLCSTVEQHAANAMIQPAEQKTHCCTSASTPACLCATHAFWADTARHLNAIKE